MQDYGLVKQSPYLLGTGTMRAYDLVIANVYTELLEEPRRHYQLLHVTLPPC